MTVHSQEPAHPTAFTASHGLTVCGVESSSEMSYMSRSRFCSLDPNHVDDPDSPHVAYEGHIVTGHGRNVIWLGPWVDGRPYKGQQTDRLQDEWDRRWDDPIWLAEQERMWESYTD